MKVLHIEQWSEAMEVFIQELHAGTGCRVEHAGSIDEGLAKIVQSHGSIDLALYSVGTAPDDALRFSERVRALTADVFIRCPLLIVLASPPLPLPCAGKCIDWQVVYLLRDYHKQIVETVRAFLWKIRTSKPGPTIRIEFHGGSYRFYLCGPTTSEEIRLGAQIGKLLLLLLRGTYTVDMLADTLGISRQSVKKYMRELNRAIKLMLDEMHLSDPVMSPVWMKRGPGGTLCGLRANPVWG